MFKFLFTKWIFYVLDIINKYSLNFIILLESIYFKEFKDLKCIYFKKIGKQIDKNKL